MWNTRDWAFFGASAVAVFGLTLAVGWPRNATADGESLITGQAMQPRLGDNGLSITARLVQNDKPVENFGRVVLKQQGAKVRMEIVISNTGSEAQTAAFRAQAYRATPSPMVSRTAMPQNTNEVFSQSYVQSIAPGESRIMDLPVGDMLLPQTLTTIKLMLDGKSIDALAVAAPPAFQVTTAPQVHP